MEFTVTEALVTLALLKRNYFISAYPGKIVIGEISNYQFETNKSFIIHRCEYRQFFKAIRCIIRSANTNEDDKQPFLSDLDHLYFWDITSASIKFGIEKKFETIYTTVFTIDEFNNFLLCFNELIPSSLLLRSVELNLFQKLAKLEVDEFFDLTENKSSLSIYTKEPIEKQKDLLILVKNNIDIIIIMHKINEIVKADEDLKNFLLDI